MRTYIALGSCFGLGLLAAHGCRYSDVDLLHCTNNEGDAYCGEKFPDGSRPYCELGLGECLSQKAQLGCVAERPADECYSPCGGRSTIDENGACVMMEDSSSGSSSEGTDTEPSTGSSSESSSTTGPMPCQSDEECTDPDAPFCGTTGECGTCSDAPDPDAVCASVDPLLPLCVGDACVACTDVNPVVCDDQLLLCDGTTNSCVPCSEHGQCPSGACELDVGRCFPQDFVVRVDGDEVAMPPELYENVADAVAAVPAGMHGVIIVHELGMDGLTPYTGSVTIDAGKTIALLAAPGEAPILQGTGAGNPGLRVEGAGTILYMDGLQVSQSPGQGMDVNGAFAWLDRSRIVQNTGGGILAETGAELTLRNCFVGGNISDVDVITINASSIDMLYTTVGGGAVAEQRTRALYCQAAVAASIRNSILVSFDPMPEVECPGAAVVTSATEADVGNLTSMWFMGYNAGEFHLSAMGATIFADIAQWTTGDPLTDIDGEPRPAVDGTADFAGADVPQ